MEWQSNSRAQWAQLQHRLSNPHRLDNLWFQGMHHFLQATTSHNRAITSPITTLNIIN